MLAALDTSVTQFAADGLLLLLIIVNAVAGWATGTLRRVVAFAGLYVGIIAAYYLGWGIASFFAKGSIVASAWAFVAIAAAGVIGAEIVGHLLADRLSHLLALAFDRGAGLLAGAAVGFFQALTLFWVALAVGNAPVTAQNGVPADHGAYASAIQTATISSPSVRALPALQAIVRPVVGDDLTGHLLNGTTSTG